MDRVRQFCPGRKHKKPRPGWPFGLQWRGFAGGSYRDRTDDIHGV